MSPYLRRFAVGFGAATLALLGLQQVAAQAIAAHNSNAPVDFAADRIELQDRQNRVVLSGNVLIQQAGLTMRSASTIINYTDAGSLQIQRITATGGVNVTRGSEAARGDVAVYDFNRRIITMSGAVGLNRGSDELNGGNLVIDLRSGRSSIEGSGAPAANGQPSGRVTGRFSVPE